MAAVPAHGAWFNGNWMQVFGSPDTIHDFVVSSDGNGGAYRVVIDVYSSDDVIRLIRWGVGARAAEGNEIPY